MEHNWALKPLNNALKGQKTHRDPTFEALLTIEDDQQMMSRLNWMTYLKVLFDKMAQEKQQRAVNLYELLDALQHIRNVLPLLSQSEYALKSSDEKGFSIKEVELGLKRHLTRSALVSWDNIIDMFLANQAFFQNEIEYPRLEEPCKYSVQDQDDMVNVSQEYQDEEGEIRPPQSDPFLYKRHLDATITKNPASHANDQSMRFSPSWEHSNTLNVQESPTVQQIAKRIEFNGMTDAKKTVFRSDTPEMVSLKVNARTKDNCSFYLTPSSGVQTPKLPQLEEVKPRSGQAQGNSNEQDAGNSRQSRSITYQYPVPFESFFNSQNEVLKLQKQESVVPIPQLTMSESCHYYDIDFSNKRIISAIQIPADLIRRDKGTHLRGVNLSKNLFSRIYMLHSQQAQQLLILNMSHNLIQSLTGIEHCQNLQFLNISHNMVTDFSPLSRMSKLQEVYLSHNLVSSILLVNQNGIQNKTVWPNLEVLDLSFNKLNDFEEVLELMNGYAVRKGTIRVVAIKGNSFYNFNDSNCTAISNELEGQDIVDKFSLYGGNPQLHKICFGSAKQSLTDKSNQVRLSGNTGKISSSNIIFNESRKKDQVRAQANQLRSSRASARRPQTKLEYTGKSPLSSRNPLSNQYAAVGGSRRPSTSLNRTQNGTMPSKKGSKAANGSKNDRDRSTLRQPQQKAMQNQIIKPSLNYYTISGLQQSTKKKSLRPSSNDRPIFNIANFDRPLSRNVRFLDLSSTPHLNKTATSNVTQNGVSKSQLSFTSNNTAANQSKLFKKGAQTQRQASKPTVINHKLKRSIDLTLSFQQLARSHKNQPTANTSKHITSQSFQFPKKVGQKKKADNKSHQNESLTTISKKISPVQPGSLRRKQQQDKQGEGTSNEQENTNPLNYSKTFEMVTSFKNFKKPAKQNATKSFIAKAAVIKVLSHKAPTGVSRPISQIGKYKREANAYSTVPSKADKKYK